MLLHEEGICVINQPNYCINEVSTHTMALLLSCIQKIPKLNIMVSKGEWNKAIKEMHVIHRLEEQKLGLIGFGKIAKN